MSKLSQTRKRIKGFEFSEIVEVVHTIPQEVRIPKRILEQIVTLTCRLRKVQIIRVSKVAQQVSNMQ